MPYSDLPTLLALLKTPLPPVRRPPGYLLGLVATALFAVLMPLVYVGLIAGVGLLCWWHLTNDWFLLGLAAHGVTGILLAIFAYLGPVLAGATMMVFLVRPLLVRAEARPDSQVLEAQQAPDFVALVHAVADAVGAPRPAEIRLDNQVNASASFRHGFAGWLSGELTLTVGLPLLEGMNTREVVGILAHEFGHFAQGGGMRLSFLVRVLIGWFQRVVTHRDEWDQKLERNAKQSDFRVGVFFHLARFFVAASRKVLEGVARLSHLVCVFLLRAMEYDADRYEARVAGSDQFARTAHHLRRLGVAWQRANGEAARAWDDGALPRDFTAYVAHLEQRLDPATDEQLAEGVKAEKRNLWATHPRDQDRIARAEAAAEPGIFHVEVPCVDLFLDFRALSEACSDVYYTSRLGQPVAPEKYLDTDAILQSSEQLRLDHEALGATVGPWAGVIFPLNWYLHEADPDLQTASADAVEQARAAIDAASAAYDETLRVVRERACYQSAEAAGYVVSKLWDALEGKSFDLPAAAETLQALLAPVHRRFARALVDLGPEAVLHLEVHRRFVAEADAIRVWQRNHSSLAYLVQQKDNGDTRRWTEIQRLLSTLKDALVHLESSFAGLGYAFAERGVPPLSDHLLGGTVNGIDSPEELFRQSGAALDRASHVYSRTLGRLARLGGLVP